MDYLNKKEFKVIYEIIKEHERQDQKWGEQNHSPVEWMSILMEEVGGAAKAVCERELMNYREELIQVAAVALAMIECLDRGYWATGRFLTGKTSLKDLL